MFILSRLLIPRSFQSFLRIFHSYQPLCADSLEIRNRTTHPLLKKRSLFEELFPEEIRIREARCEEEGQNVPRLPLPEIDEFFEDFQDDLSRGWEYGEEVTKDIAVNTIKRNNITVLILHIAGKSLVESDFRRIAPKGKHIDDWIGPGDILKGPYKDSLLLLSR